MTDQERIEEMCFHSMVKRDCLSCVLGENERLAAAYRSEKSRADDTLRAFKAEEARAEFELKRADELSQRCSKLGEDVHQLIEESAGKDAKLDALAKELAEAKVARLNTEKDLIRAWTLVDTLRDALSALRVRVLEVYAGPSPMLDEVWEQSRKALAKETYEHYD